MTPQKKKQRHSWLETNHRERLSHCLTLCFWLYEMSMWQINIYYTYSKSWQLFTLTEIFNMGSVSPRSWTPNCVYCKKYSGEDWIIIQSDLIDLITTIHLLQIIKTNSVLLLFSITYWWKAMGNRNLTKQKQTDSALLMKITHIVWDFLQFLSCRTQLNMGFTL